MTTPGSPFDQVPALAWTSERTLRITLGDQISPATSDAVAAVDDALRAAVLPGVSDITPAYASVFVEFDPLTLDPAVAESAVLTAIKSVAQRSAGEPRLIEVPVCYADEFAPDLSDVAALHGISAEAVIKLHTSGSYRVAFLGFTPGFAYLSGLSKGLHTPRLVRPRTTVPAGSVAIGGAQTGVYPHPTPGGWRIVGRTPIVMFDAARRPAAHLSIGDRVQFVPIDRARFDLIARGGK